MRVWIKFNSHMFDEDKIAVINSETNWKLYKSPVHLLI